MAARNTARPQDLTGATKEKLEAEKAAEREAAAEHLATLAATKSENDGVVEWDEEKNGPKVESSDSADAEGKQDAAKSDNPTTVFGSPVAVSRQVQVKEEIVSFKVRETLEMVTIGAGNHYTFEEGKTYKYPKHIYDHLEEKGMIWH